MIKEFERNDVAQQAGEREEEKGRIREIHRNHLPRGYAATPTSAFRAVDHFSSLSFRGRERMPAAPVEDLPPMPDSAKKNQFRALRRRRRTSLGDPRDGAGDIERERRRGCDRERVKDHERGLGAEEEAFLGRDVKDGRGGEEGVSRRNQERERVGTVLFGRTM